MYAVSVIKHGMQGLIEYDNRRRLHYVSTHNVVFEYFFLHQYAHNLDMHILSTYVTNPSLKCWAATHKNFTLLKI